MFTPTDDVREFHEKHGFTIARNTPNSAVTDGEVRGQLLLASTLLASIAKQWENGTVGPEVPAIVGQTYTDALLRPHLILEELAEFLEALALGNEEGMLDGLADLDYVVHGTAVAYDLPLEAAFDEVHRSNMTKALRTTEALDKDVRLRNKGKEYEPPRLKMLLKAYRKDPRRFKNMREYGAGLTRIYEAIMNDEPESYKTEGCKSGRL